MKSRSQDGESLWVDAVLAGPDGWPRLLEATELQENDDRTCNGYILKAWATDAVSGAAGEGETWTDLCQDQVNRIYECLIPIDRE